MSTRILIQYNSGDSQVSWNDCRTLNTVTTAAIVSVTMLDETVIVLKEYDSQEQAKTAREGLRKAIADAVAADGGTTVVIDIDDF